TRPFAGYKGGLLELKIKQLLAVEEAPIILSTNDPESLRIAEQFQSPRLHVIKRPEELALSSTPLQELINYVPEVTKAQHIIWTHATSPFVHSELYKAALKSYFKQLSQGFDSLMTATKIQDFIWDAEQNSPVNYDRKKEKWPRTQDLKPLYAINSGIFINSRKNYCTLNDRIGKKPYLMP